MENDMLCLAQRCQWREELGHAMMLYGGKLNDGTTWGLTCYDEISKTIPGIN
jgi:hypothetical protein